MKYQSSFKSEADGLEISVGWRENMAIKYEGSFLSEADTLEISVLCLMPEPGIKPRAIVQLVHGMSEHKERYIPFMQYLAKLGYVVVIHDHRGHGKSVKHQDDLGFTYGGGEQENPCILSGTSADPDGAQYGLAGSEGICGRT